MALPLLAAPLIMGGLSAGAGILGGLQKDDTGKAQLKFLNRSNKKALGMLDQIGLTNQQQIEARYMHDLGKLQGNLIDRGITNSTVAATLAQGLKRQKGQDLTSARENLALDRANVLRGGALQSAQLGLQQANLNRPDFSGLVSALQPIGGAIANYQNQQGMSNLLKSLSGSSGYGGTWMNARGGALA